MHMDAMVAWESYMEGSLWTNSLRAYCRPLYNCIEDEELPKGWRLPHTILLVTNRVTALVLEGRWRTAAYGSLAA